MFNFFKKDKKEDAILRSKKAAHALVHSDAWNDIQQMFIDKIMDIQSIMNVDDSSVDKIVMDMKVRANLAKELKDILDNIIGAANSYEYEKEPKIVEETEIVVDLN